MMVRILAFLIVISSLVLFSSCTTNHEAKNSEKPGKDKVDSISLIGDQSKKEEVAMRESDPNEEKNPSKATKEKQEDTPDKKIEVRARVEKKQTPKKVETVVNSEQMQKTNVPKPKPKPIAKANIYFPDTLFNFGFINEGDSISYSFKFLNTGDGQLEIMDVQVTCGCTIPTYPLEPILPGRIGKVDVTYNSHGKFGKQLARIDILTNADPELTSLYLKGVVRTALADED
jgi:hypothetical protein